MFNTTPDWGGPHLCHLALDRLAGYVNEGILQTVVDQVRSPTQAIENYNIDILIVGLCAIVMQVYTTDDAEKAIAHICSPKAIGGTIITFRS